LTAATAVLVNFAVTAAVLLVVMAAVFLVGRAIGRHRIVDAVWGAAFALVALVTYGLSADHGDGVRRALITALTVVWGLRLAVHIGLRGRGAPEDPRYEAMLAKAPGNRDWYAFRKVYLLQGALIWFVSLPVQVGQYPGPVATWLTVATAVVGCVLWAVGFFFETVGDWQLERFKADPSKRGTLLTTGLRRYTRHPNYFGDACVWWGLFALACLTPWGLLTVLSPVGMTWLLTSGSGKPLMEKHLKENKPGYAAYAERTSSFVPLPPRGR
jgi:steroid 5-alpha reductase family enzyme